MAGSNISIEQQEFLHILDKWWITVAVMGSLLMQLLLLLTGGTRKWNMACRFVAWNAYNWSDFVATSALGGLAQGAAGLNAKKKEVYAIWAPILLLHLGAPDNISAYAMADAELWQRHGLTMLLQVAMVVYVVANCARGWKYVLLSICLTALGSIKYAERTFALKHASRADVIDSALPIYKYMLEEARLNLDIKGPTLSSRSVLPASHTLHPNPSYYYIIQGEKQWFQKFLHAGNTNYSHGFREAALSTPELVTLQDILCSKQLRQTAPSMVLLCAGFALFKLYKRRLSNLYMYEWREEKTRQLFVPKQVFEDVKEIIFVLDVELRFLFDSLYTKAAGTAFSKLGVSFRMLTTILLVVSGVFIFGDLNFHDQADLEQARNVTFCLIVAALVVEAYQLARLALSDWSRVWLVCTFIIVGEELKNQSNSSISYFLKRLWQATLLGMIKFYSHIGRHKYWRSSIGQFTILDVNNWSGWRRCINPKLARLIRRDQLQLLPKYVHNKQVVEEFKSYVFTKALEACRGAPRRHQTLPPDWFMRKYNDGYLQRRIVQAAFGTNGHDPVYIDLEHLMVNWHVATCMCELLATQPCPTQHVDVEVPHHEHANIHISNGTISRHGAGSPAASPGHDQLAAGRENTTDVDLRMSKLLSRYMMYLLVHKTELLPCHADIARQVAADTQRDMCAITWNTEFIMQRAHTPNMQGVPFNLRSGMKAGSLLQDLPSDHVRWRLVADVWVDILVCAASSNKPIEQLHQLTVGGEFLTHLWVLLGHMGNGAQ